MIFHPREFFHYVTIASFHIIESRTGQRNAVQCNFYSRLKLEQYATIPKTFLEINLIFSINLFTSYFKLLYTKKLQAPYNKDIEANCKVEVENGIQRLIVNFMEISARFLNAFRRNLYCKIVLFLV